MKVNTPASVAKMQDDILKLQAANQVHKQLSPIAKSKFVATFGDTLDSITSAVDEGLLEGTMASSIASIPSSGVKLPPNLENINRSELESILLSVTDIQSGAATKRTIVDFADTYLDKSLTMKQSKESLQSEALRSWNAIEPILNQKLGVNISYDAQNEQFDIFGYYKINNY
jgi:hypothetical protein